MDTRLYLRIRGRVLGPYDLENLRSLAHRGQLSRFHELSQDGTNWVCASAYPELFSSDGSPNTVGPAATETRHGAAQAGEPGRELAGQEAPAFVITQGQRRTPSSGNRSYLLPIAISCVAGVALLVFVLAVFLSLNRAGQTRQEEEASQAANAQPGAAVPSARPPIKNSEATANAVGRDETNQAANADPSTPVPPAVSSIKEHKPATKAVGRDVTNKGANTDLGTPVPPTVSSIKEHKAIADAVGKVVMGGEITNYEGQLFEVARSSGSAFAINQNGAMLTNKHVVEEYLNLSRADQLKADLSRLHKLKLREMLWVFVNGEKYVAKLVYTSPKHDYAILKIDRRFSRPFALKLSSSDLLDAEVRAIGFPGVATEGFSEQEIEQQIAKNQHPHADVAEEFNERDMQYLLTSGRVSQVTGDEALRATWLQHTANIAHGNSGGPLVLSDATVVGINTRMAGNTHELGAQVFRALCVGQFHKEIDQQVHGVTWVP
jgi:S1-C subfamily serine protease